MNLSDITTRLLAVSDSYAAKFNIDRSADWFLLKIQEELGELTSAHLKLTGRARVGKESQEAIRENLEHEIADVLAMTLLFAQHHGVNVEKALQEKWFRWLEGPARP